MEIRTARVDDAPYIASLIYSAGPEIYDFIYGTERHDPLRFIEFEFRSGRGFCGHRNVTVALRDGRVVATGCFFNGRQYNALTWGTVVNMFRFYGLRDVWPALGRSLHADSVMKRPRNRELYLSNFGVSPSHRGQGVGAEVIRRKLAEAKATGHTLFGLDVASTNPRAQRLYERMGLRFVQQKRFSGKRRGHAVPDARKMEMKLG